MITNLKFNYPKSVRSLINDQRHYDIDAVKLPSVTTILAQTMPEDKKQKLQDWKTRIGNDEADKIKNEAANRGTFMHSYIEGYLLGQRHLDLTELGQEATKMGQVVVEKGLKELEELWGIEAVLHYPDLYAGSTDIVGIYNGKQSIIDLKQSNKMKRESWIGDYMLQLSAYIMAHNYIYQTNIQQGVILMCTPKLEFQRFIIEGSILQKYTYEWLKRVDLFYKQNNEVKHIPSSN
jgi:CRISPR/Cas system-associated exonuclease Cas4 (RecB family)